MRRAWRGYFDLLSGALAMIVTWFIPDKVLFDVVSVLVMAFLAWRVYVWLGRKPKGADGHHHSPEES